MATTTTTPEEDISTTADELATPNPRFNRILESIHSGSGMPIFSKKLTEVQTQNTIDSFVLQQSEITNEDATAISLFNFSNDLLPNLNIIYNFLNVANLCPTIVSDGSPPR